MTDELTTINCNTCGQPVEVLARWVHHGVTCEPCIRKASQVALTRDRTADTRALWQRLCPEAFQDTDFDKLPNPVESTKAMEWPYNDQPHGYGLMLWGTPRTGKTRTMWLILKREHLAGKVIRAFEPGQFLVSYDENAQHRASWLKRLTTCDILAFDDIDKFKLPRTVEEAFFSIVNTRMSNKRPCFFTGNVAGDALQLKFNQGEPLIARIRESCFPVRFK